jgi:hypothetical protein
MLNASGLYALKKINKRRTTEVRRRAEEVIHNLFSALLPLSAFLRFINFFVFGKQVMPPC